MPEFTETADENRKTEHSVTGSYKKVEDGILLTFGEPGDKCVEILLVQNEEESG